jgi:spermidine synthase
MDVVSSQASQPRMSAPNSTKSDNLSFYYLLFFLSGFPALLYQIVWQRALFTLYGVNVESVTMIVTVFMLGLGLGSLFGGRLSSLPKIRPLVAFGIIEISIGLFGSASLWIFHRVGALTAGHSTLVTGMVSFALLLIPTLLMGSTLPLLVEHVVRTTGNVGESVGSLYAVNTFGSAVACLAAAIVLMDALGESGVVDLACCFNLMVGAAAIAVGIRNVSAAAAKTSMESRHPNPTVPFWVGVLLAGITGFIALAYEIIWYRVYSFTTGGRASAFALLLAFYLVGIAIGSIAVQNACKEKLDNDLSRTLWAAACVVLLGSICAFLLGPAVARTVVHIPFGFTYFFVLISAGLLGSAFPLLAHATIASGSGAGKEISYLYLSNILGSTLGSFLVGFVILNYWSTRTTCTFLLCVGFLAFLALASLAKPQGRMLWIVVGCLACLALTSGSSAIYSGMYERLLASHELVAEHQFAEFVENRSGEIAVLQDGTVYGGGVYDGRFNIDLINDTNGIFRPFAIAGLHPNPTNMLIIGLSSGSWAQVAAGNPAVKDVTIVEINPGYLQLIKKHNDVESLLQNPKVHIVIDDGRRWLVSHPDRKFDFILMNTTHHWRAHASNLLSREFLMLIRAHLNPGGIEYYNTTWSEEAMATGMSVFPYSLRVSSFIAVSDSPFDLDKERWRHALTSYAIDSHQVFDLSQPLHQKRLEEVLAIADKSTDPHRGSESRADMQKRLANTPIITDDNMGTEWK